MLIFIFFQICFYIQFSVSFGGFYFDISACLSFRSPWVFPQLGTLESVLFIIYIWVIQ
jgi:hypothetical protein